MTSHAVARRYATALVDSVKKEPPAVLDRFADELGRLGKAIDAMPDLRNALLNPVFGPAEKEKVLKGIAEKYALDPRTARFLKVLMENDRLAELSAVAETVGRLADEKAGRVRAVIETATPLSEELRAELQGALEKKTGKSIVLEIKIDPTLVAGVRTRIGSLVFDGSVRGELNRLREKLAKPN